MADEVINSGNSSSAANSGVGPVVFDSGVSISDQHIANLKSTDEYIAQQKKDQLAAQKEGFELVKNLHVNTQGALPADIQGTIQPMMDKMSKAGGQFLALGSNFQNPLAGAAYIAMNNYQQKATDLADISRENNKAILSAVATQAKSPEKWDAVGLKDAIAKNLAIPLEYRPAITENDLLVAKPPDLDVAIDKYLDQTYGKNRKAVTESTDIEGSYIHDKTLTETIRKANIPAVANTILQMPSLKSSVDTAWSANKEANPAEVQKSIDKGVATGLDVTKAEDAAKNEWLQGKLLNGHYQFSAVDKIKGFTQEAYMARIGYRAQLSDKKTMNDYGGWADVIADAYKGQPGAVTGLKGIKLNDYVADRDINTYTADGKLGHTVTKGTTLHNYVVDAGRLPDGRFGLYTSQSEDTGAATGQGKKDLMIPFNSYRDLLAYLGERMDKKAYGGMMNYIKMNKGMGADGYPDAQKMGHYNPDAGKPTATPAGKQYSVAGKTYKSVDEIKALSPAYTDDVINQAIKAGTIKVQ